MAGVWDRITLDIHIKSCNKIFKNKCTESNTNQNIVERDAFFYNLI